MTRRAGNIVPPALQTVTSITNELLGEVVFRIEHYANANPKNNPTEHIVGDGGHSPDQNQGRSIDDPSPRAYLEHELRDSDHHRLGPVRKAL